MLLLSAPTPSSLSAGGGSASMWPLIGGFLGFAAILALSYFGLRYLSRKNLFAARGRHMRVLDRMVVGRDSMILLVRVADKVFVTGIAKEGIHMLGEIDPDKLSETPDEISRPESDAPAPSVAPSFQEELRHSQEEFDPKDEKAVLPDYDEAIKRMRRYSRMEIEAKKEPEDEQQKLAEEIDAIEMLSDRIGKRTQRLTRQLEPGGGNRLE